MGCSLVLDLRITWMIRFRRRFGRPEHTQHLCITFHLQNAFVKNQELYSFLNRVWTVARTGKTLDISHLDWSVLFCSQLHEMEFMLCKAKYFLKITQKDLCSMHHPYVLQRSPSCESAQGLRPILSCCPELHSSIQGSVATGPSRFLPHSQTVVLHQHSLVRLWPSHNNGSEARITVPRSVKSVLWLK